MRINYVTNASPESGVGHQAEELARRLQALTSVDLSRWHIDGQTARLFRDGQEIIGVNPWPGALGSKSVNWVRLGRRISQERDAAPYHFTNQTLSFLAKNIQPAIVTVHDIIELLEPQTQKAYWLNRYLYSGIEHAQHIICVSEYTKKTVQEYYNIPEDRITVVYNGVGVEFQPIDQFDKTLAFQELRHTLELPAQARIVLYVGSDHPRKNVITAVQAFAKVLRQSSLPLVFVKVGSAGLLSGRTALLEEMDRLALRESVRIREHVTVDQLNMLYNLAEVLLYPSRFEGFGLPPLQAMAAGTPVVASRATSLPEVIGSAGLLNDPDDVEGFARSLTNILMDQQLAMTLRQRGLQQAQRFSWEVAAQQTQEVYQFVNQEM